MCTAFNGRDHGHTDVRDVLQNLNALIMDLAQHARIGNVAEGGEVDTGKEVPA